MGTKDIGGHDQTDKRKPWHKRPTVRALRRDAERTDQEQTQSWDDRDNKKTKLPLSEDVNFGGFVLTEAFTPSTVSALYRTLEDWPTNRPKRRDELLESLSRSRAGGGGGWQNLGVIRPPGAFLMGDGHHDPDLPTGVEAVWLSVSFITPALAMVVATFTISESAGDLSLLLRSDYNSRHLETKLYVYGQMGALRARIPWARPTRHAAGYSMSTAEDQKRNACIALMEKLERSCNSWFFQKFSGRFAAIQRLERPAIRLLFTQEAIPYTSRSSWLRPVGLDFNFPLWKSTEIEGWWLSASDWSERRRSSLVTLAARRSDVARDPVDGETRESNWYLTQRVSTDQDAFAARHALTALMGLYADRLGGFRDAAGKKRRLRRPVRDGKELNDYLVGDGLDVATVTSDLRAFTKDLNIFRWGVPEFTEYRQHLPDGVRDRPPIEYLPALRDTIRRQAKRLAADTRITTENVRASAELRQSISNTRLQRLTLALSVAAALVAVISLLVANH